LHDSTSTIISTLVVIENGNQLIAFENGNFNGIAVENGNFNGNQSSTSHDARSELPVGARTWARAAVRGDSVT